MSGSCNLSFHDPCHQATIKIIVELQISLTRWNSEIGHRLDAPIDDARKLLPAEARQLIVDQGCQLIAKHGLNKSFFKPSTSWQRS